jgi:predicted component of type VI protein secretion system
MLPLVIQIERTQERVADTCAFAKSPVRLGRNALNDLQLDESFVSQWHGVIRFDETQTTYVDLGSTNPTLVDGQPVKRNVEIVISETTDLRIGSLRLHLIRVVAPPELFGARRRTAFARTGGVETGSLVATMYLGAGAAAAMVANHQRAQPSAEPRALNVPSGAPAGPASAPAPARPSPSAPAPSAPSRAGEAASLRSAYEQYRSAWRVLLGQLQAELHRTSGPEREAFVDRLATEFPGLGHEAELRELMSRLGVNPLRTGVPEMDDWLKRLTNGLFPPPGMPINVALAMERIGEMLEVFSTAFIELRRAHTNFCEEMSLEKPDDSSMLQTTENPRALLAYLLNPGSEGAAKVDELSRAMADFAVHQVALVSAVVQGARDMLEELSPQTFASANQESAKGSVFSKLFANEKETLWQRYLAVFEDTVDEDRFTRKLFGRSFARKYYAITGGRRSIPPSGKR